MTQEHHSHARDASQSLQLLSWQFWGKQIASVPTLMEQFVADGCTAVEFHLPTEAVKFFNRSKWLICSELCSKPAGWTAELIRKFEELGYQTRLIPMCSRNSGYLYCILKVSVPGAPQGKVGTSGAFNGSPYSYAKSSEEVTTSTPFGQLLSELAQLPREILGL